MNVYIELVEIHYADVAVKLLPHLRPSGSAAGLLTEAVSKLPEQVIRTVFDAIPLEKQDEIAAAFLSEHREELCRWATGFLKEQGIGVEIKDVTLSQNLELILQLGDIDYVSLVQTFFASQEKDLAAQEPLDRVLASLRMLPGFLLTKAVAAMSQERRDEILAALVNRVGDQLLSKLMELARQQNIHLTLKNIRIIR